MIERILDRLFDDLLGFRRRQPVLGLALEFRLAHEHRKHHRSAHHDVFRGDRGGALALADALGVVFKAAQHRAAHAELVRAAVGCRHRVAIGGEEAVGVRRPGDRPFAGAMGAVAARFAGEDIRMHQRVGVDSGGEIVLQAADEVEFVLGGHLFDALQQRGIAAPADFHAAKQIGLRARHLEQPLRLEGGFGAENIGVGLEANPGAPAVVDLAEILELAFGMTALERHLVELLLARDLDLEQRGEGVDDGDADAVQTARGLIDLGIELAAGMQRAHDDFERGFFRKFRMRIDRDAAAVIGDGQKSIGAQFHLDEGGVSRQRLVHRIIDDFGEQMMQRLFVGAADIHAGTPAYRLQSFQHLDVGRGIAGLGAGRPRRGLGRRAALRVRAKEIGGFGFCS